MEINVGTIKFTQDHIHNINIDNRFELRLKNGPHSRTNSHITISMLESYLLLGSTVILFVDLECDLYGVNRYSIHT